MKKIGLFEQPRIYYIYIFVLLAFYLFNRLLKNEYLEVGIWTLLFLYIASISMYLFHKSKIKINSVSGNSLEAMGIGVMMILFLLTFSTIIGIFLGYGSDFGSVMTANSIAMVGAIPQFILLNSPFIMFFLIVFFIASLETIVLIQLLDITLFYLNVPYTLKNIKVWIISIILGLGAIIYHAYSKFIELTGTVNIHALIIVGLLFSSSCLLAIHQKEMESAIYYHIGNNFIAMIYKLKNILNLFGL